MLCLTMWCVAMCLLGVAGAGNIFLVFLCLYVHVHALPIQKNGFN